MKSLVDDAIRYQQQEQLEHDGGLNFDDIDLENVGKARIVVVGCGGAGNNTINRLHHMDVKGIESIAINTDKQDLDRVNADKKILIGRTITRGLGAGGNPDVGRRAAEMARNTITEVLTGADLVFVTAGMGGGTGTGSAPVVSDVYKRQGAIVVGMVSTPFNVERARGIKAEEGLIALQNAADTVIVLDNNKLLDFAPNLPIGQAFSVMDQLIADTTKGISETITQPSLINLDYADVRTVMSRGGLAVMIVGESNNRDRGQDVVKKALNNPLLDVDYRGATGALVHITGGPDMTLRDAEDIASSITYDLDPHADVIWGARVRDDFEGKLKVMAIMTGVQSPHNFMSGGTYAEPRTITNPRKVSPVPSRQSPTPAPRSQNGSIIDNIRNGSIIDNIR